MSGFSALSANKYHQFDPVHLKPLCDFIATSGQTHKCSKRDFAEFGQVHNTQDFDEVSIPLYPFEEIKLSLYISL
jgi:hypothetical protein